MQESIVKDTAKTTRQTTTLERALGVVMVLLCLEFMIAGAGSLLGEMFLQKVVSLKDIGKYLFAILLVLPLGVRFSYICISSSKFWDGRYGKIAKITVPLLVLGNLWLIFK